MQLDFSAVRGPRERCPSDLALERHHRDELDAAERAEISTHIESCEHCRAALEEIEAGFAEGLDHQGLLARILAEAPAIELAPAQPGLIDKLREAWSSWTLVGGGLTLLAGAAALLIALPLINETPTVGPIPPVGQPDQRPENRFKGGAILKVFRFEGASSKEVSSGDAFHAGDRLRFVVDLLEPGHLAVYGVEAGGAVYRAWPLEPEAPAEAMRFDEGKDQALPGAVALDDQPGEERLYAVHCSKIGPPICQAADNPKGIRCQEGCDVGGAFSLKKQQPAP